MNTAAQLLWIETVLKALGGAFLILTPITTAKVFGLPITPTGFWVRLLGAVLLGLAAATYIEGALHDGQGLGLGGACAINVCAALTLMAMLVGGRAAPKPRGRMALWLLVAVLAILSAIELIWLAAR